MSIAVQDFRLTNLKRAIRAATESGVKIAKICVTKEGRIEIEPESIKLPPKKVIKQREGAAS